MVRPPSLTSSNLPFTISRTSSGVSKRLRITSCMGDWPGTKEPERVDPVVLAKAGNAPQHGERLHGPRGGRSTQVFSVPAELLQDLGDQRLGSGVIAAVEHRRRPSGQQRV